jgi:hypothetical protein
MYFGTDPDLEFQIRAFRIQSGSSPFFSMSGEHLNLNFLTFTKTYMVLYKMFIPKQCVHDIFFKIKLIKIEDGEKSFIIIISSSSSAEKKDLEPERPKMLYILRVRIRNRFRDISKFAS